MKKKKRIAFLIEQIHRDAWKIGRFICKTYKLFEFSMKNALKLKAIKMLPFQWIGNTAKVDDKIHRCSAKTV